MLLAEALNERAGKAKYVQQIAGRIAASARYQEGEVPAENAAALLEDGRRAVREIGVLAARINRTNNATELYPDAGETITGAIARRDALAAERALVADAAQAGSGGRGAFAMRQFRSEIRIVTDLPVADLRTAADELARQHRVLDTQIQQANWATELLD